MKSPWTLGHALWSSFLGTALLTTAAAAAPAVPRTEAVSIYSSLCYNDDSGDLNGWRLLLVNAYTYKSVIYQAAGGGDLEPPQAVRVDIRGEHIDFRVDEGHELHRTFTGKITPEAIVGSFSDDPKAVIQLRRSANELAPAPSCGPGMGWQIGPDAKP